MNSYRLIQKDISWIIKKTLDAEKTHGWDIISTKKMIQICGNPIALPYVISI